MKVLQPDITFEEYQNNFIAPTPCIDLADYISRATVAVNLMQTPEQLRLVTLDLMAQLKEDNIIYTEIRFAPLHHIQGGLTSEQVMETVCKAIKEGSDQTGIPAGLIVCTLRHYNEAQSMESVKLAEKYKEQGVVGFDIAADEAGYSIDEHISAFQYAKQKGIPCTSHAGEAKGPESVWETLEQFSSVRIGHGVRSIEDVQLIEFLKEKNIHLEVCPTSNIQTGIFKSYDQHSVDFLFKKGVSIGINTDCRTVSNTTLSEEYDHLQRSFGWTKEHFMQCNLSAIKHAFTTDDIKAQLKAQIEKSYTAD